MDGVPRLANAPPRQSERWFRIPQVVTQPALMGSALCLMLAFAYAAHSQGVRSANAESRGQERQSAQFQSRQPTSIERCVVCHPAEVRGFAQSAMAHALRRSGQEPEGSVTAHGSTITMHNSPTGFIQTLENGGEKGSYRVDYVIGSGEHASGYLVNIGGHLFQSPVAFYKNRRSYDVAPGYENQPDPDFTRPISEECLLCHSGQSLHIPGTLNQYSPPVFAAEGITCERCHGPSQRHLADPRAGTILNPSTMERAARDSICEQCHLFGVARVPNPGKEISDFVPGRPLEDTFTIYRNVMPEGAPAGDFKVISHVEQLALSACARNSEGRLWCVTCHNPHEKLQKSPAYYRSRCLSCHAANWTTTTHPGKDSECLGCHMPRRDAKDGGHTVFTDHRIQRRPEVPIELPANSTISAWREPAPEFQKRNRGIAYIDVGMQRHSSSFIIQGYRALTEVQNRFTNDPEFFQWIGEALLVAKQTSDAKLAFNRALQLEPDSALAQARAASPYIQGEDDTQATAHLERAVELDPLFLPAISTLSGLYEKNGNNTAAAELSGKTRLAMSAGSTDGILGASPPAMPAEKTAEEVFKNTQTLKGIPADQIVPAMEFMASSLGVECTYCHVEGHFEKDDKKPKQTAREMIKMMSAINSNSFEGRQEVTCYSCHRGSSKPVGTPALEAKDRLNRRVEPSLPKSLPTVDEVLQRYVSALGGASAIQKIASRIETGHTDVAGKSLPVEIFVQSPDKWALVRHLPEGQSTTVYDGRSGWFSMPGRNPRELHPADLEAVRMDADLQFPLHMRQMFPALRVEYPETVAGREASVLFAEREGRPTAKFYFDNQSGLLVRVVRYSESALGINPSQVDYMDYRDVGGVQVPFRVNLSEPGSSSTTQLEKIERNVAIDRAKFSKPTDPKH
jgi:photosynthetic reaction center cytochrome c subunit